MIKFFHAFQVLVDVHEDPNLLVAYGNLHFVSFPFCALPQTVCLMLCGNS